jgi:hypothetical protein
MTDIPNSNISPKPTSIPVFDCIVYVSSEPGGVRARVANLPGLTATAATERQALAKLVAAFKQQIAEQMQNQTPIHWIEPPSPPEIGEQKRLIPVHL